MSSRPVLKAVRRDCNGPRPLCPVQPATNQQPNLPTQTRKGSKRCNSSGNPSSSKKFKSDAKENNEPLQVAGTIKPTRMSKQKAIQQVRQAPNQYPKHLMSRRLRRDLRRTEGKSETKLHGSTDCFICEKKNTEENSAIIRCEGQTGNSNCVVRMHATCASVYNVDGVTIIYNALPECANKLLCPLHLCSACGMENRKQRAYEGEIIQCFLCFNAYHKECYPTAAFKLPIKLENQQGVVESVEMMVCPAHIDRENDFVKHLDLCSECDDTDNLKKCATCPQSFHLGCRNATRSDGNEFFDKCCNDCFSEKIIRKDSLVLFSNGKGFVLAKTKVNDYCAPGHTALDLGNNKFTTAPISTIASMKPQYLKKISPKNQEAWKEELEKLGNITFAPLFKKVLKETQTNLTTFAKLPREPLRSKGMECCEDFMAINCECPKSCKPDHGKCNNRQISNKEINTKMELAKFDNKGFGVVATADMAEGEFIGEFVGEVITTEEEIRRRTIKAESKDVEAAYYFYTLNENKKIVIDATKLGNITRYLNHSCKPNAVTYMRRVIVGDQMEERLFMQTTRPIKKGEEITLDYQWDEMTCYCEEDNCRYN